MKKVALIFMMLSCGLFMQAQNDVMFEFSDGIDAGGLKRKMEQQVVKLLTAINTAESEGANINYSGIDIDNLASQSIGMTWNNVRFRTIDNDIVEHCIRLQRSNGSLRGFQVRNIGVEMKPLDDAFDKQKSKYQEICIDFNQSGQIVDFNFAMGTRQYQQLLKEGVRLNDVDRRLQIIHWCEQFKKAYNDKNLKFMEDIFSNDALIITGKVVMQRQKSEVGMVDEKKVQYVEKNKQQYLASLRRVFDREKHNGYINVEFNDYEIKRHGSKPQYYAVTLRQNWYSSSYSDEGMVVLVWDFTNEEQPKIQVRTWQPMQESVFGFSDIKLP